MLPSANSLLQEPVPASRYHNHVNLPKIKVPDYHVLSTPEATPNSSFFNNSFKFRGSQPLNSTSHNTATPHHINLPTTPIKTPQSSSTNSFSPLPSLRTLGNDLIRPTSASNTNLPPLVMKNNSRSECLLSPPNSEVSLPKLSSSMRSPADIPTTLPSINEFASFNGGSYSSHASEHRKSISSGYNRSPQPLPSYRPCENSYFPSQYSHPPPPPPPIHTHPSNFNYGQPTPNTPSVHQSFSPPSQAPQPHYSHPVQPSTQYNEVSRGIGLGVFVPPENASKPGAMKHNSSYLVSSGFNAANSSSRNNNNGLATASNPIGTKFKNIMSLPVGSREIKRRTKTGCMTCRKRRIKCDERHPTCFNCDKSKRVCINYDPVFRSSQERRKLLARRSSLRMFASGYTSPDGNDSSNSKHYGISASTQLRLPKFGSSFVSTKHSGSGNSNDTKCIKSKMDISSLLDAAAVIEESSNQFSSAAAPPSSSSSSSSFSSVRSSSYSSPDSTTSNFSFQEKVSQVPWYERNNNCDRWDKIEAFFTYYVAPNLDSLFAIQKCPPASNSYKTGVLKKGRYKVKDAKETVGAKNGDEIYDDSPEVPTDYGLRFSQMNILNLSKVSGLPLTGSKSMTIPGSNNSARGSFSSVGGFSLQYIPSYPNQKQFSSINSSHKSETGSSAELNNGYSTILAAANSFSSNSTVQIGQSLAILEAVRQLLVTVLPPSFAVNKSLIIDESTVGKLEELRISNDYKALRAVFQLLSDDFEMGPDNRNSRANREKLAGNQILGTDEKDSELLAKVKILNKFVNLDYSSNAFETTIDQADSESQDKSKDDRKKGLKKVEIEDLKNMFEELEQINDSNHSNVNAENVHSHSLRQWLHPEKVWSLMTYISQPLDGNMTRLTNREVETILRYATFDLYHLAPEGKVGSRSGLAADPAETDALIDYALENNSKPPYLDTGAGSLELALLLAIYYYMKYNEYANNQCEQQGPDVNYEVNSEQVKSLLIEGSKYWNQNVIMRRLISFV